MELARFKIGDEVFIVSEPDAVGVVIPEPRRLANEWWYPVSFGVRRRDCPEASLEKYTGGHDIISLLQENKFSGRDGLSKLVTFNKLKQPLRNNLYAYRASRTEFHPYQFKPLVKLLNSTNQRLLIADEVGLGKTIEAGFIYQEMDARYNLNRVLIVCPSALRGKWCEEMGRRFGEEFDILDSRGMRLFLSKLQSYNPFIKLRGICSLQTLRSEGLLRLLEEVSPSFDLVIVDEAHHMRNSGTLSNQLGQVLSEQAETMLLLTATPIHLGNTNLFQLLHILDPDEFESPDTLDRVLEANRPVIEADRILRQGTMADVQKSRDILRTVERGELKERFTSSPIYINVLEKLEHADGSDRATVIDIQRDIAQLNLLGHILTRTRKREVSETQPIRQPMVIAARWTPEEQGLYDQVTDYCRQRIELNRAYASVASWFPVITLQRQIASCIPATIRHYLDHTEQIPSSTGEDLSDLDIGDFTEESYEDSEFLTLRDDPGLLEILAKAGKSLTKDSKFEELVTHLKAIDKAEFGRKVLIFSYFKKTLEYLSERLKSADYTCVMVTGDVPSRPNDPDRDERGHRMLQFKNDPNIRIMLSSEVGSEGLDFQFAHILINYDLPWNPMIVEQRIGRLDRFGQKSERILIYNFSIPGTIEDRILQRLYSRIRIFEQSIGDLESILGTQIHQLTLDLLASKLTEAEQERRIEECAEVIERKRQDMHVLEQQAVQFIGQDAYFQQELEEIRKNKRYVTSRELEVLIGDFIIREFPASTWEERTEEKCFDLKLDKELAALVRSNISKEDSVSASFFVDKASRTAIVVTCDGELAYENENVHLINCRHTLVETIVNYYETHLDRLHPVSCVEIHSTIEDISSGDYTYFLYLVEHQSARPGKTLEAVFISVAGDAILQMDQSERLLSDMVVASESLQPVRLDSHLARQCFDLAEETIRQRIRKQRDELEKTNDDIVTRRIASLDTTYRSKREKISNRLERAIEGQKQPQYIRMLEGTLRNLDSRYEGKVKEIEAGRRVDIQLEPLGAGVVRVNTDAKKEE
jgi:superfamily II DNA or RNA helicase